MPYSITEQGDLGLGLNVISEEVYNESMKDEDEKSKKDDNEKDEDEDE